MRKHKVTILLTIAAGLLITGCGSGSEEPSGQANAQSSAGVEASAAEETSSSSSVGEKTVVEFWYCSAN